jgi:hypothetical protein
MRGFPADIFSTVLFYGRTVFSCKNGCLTVCKELQKRERFLDVFPSEKQRFIEASAKLCKTSFLN